MGILWTCLTHHFASHFSHTRMKKKMYKGPGIVGALCQQHRTIMHKVLFFLAIVIFIFTHPSDGKFICMAYTIDRIKTFTQHFGSLSFKLYVYQTAQLAMPPAPKLITAVIISVSLQAAETLAHLRRHHAYMVVTTLHSS